MPSAARCIARRAAALMPHGGSMVTLTYGGSTRVMPNYNVMGVAKASLEERPELAAILESPENKWSGSYVNFAGDRVLGTSTPIPATNWIVLTELDQAEALAILEKMAGQQAMHNLFFHAHSGKITELCSCCTCCCACEAATARIAAAAPSACCTFLEMFSQKSYGSKSRRSSSSSRT